MGASITHEQPPAPRCARCGVPAAGHVSPTARSLELLRAEGWLCQVVEQTIRGRGIVFKRDLFTVGDIIGIREDQTLLVQTTSGSNFASRLAKIGNCEHLPNIGRAGWRLELHGWRKLRGRWQCRREAWLWKLAHGVDS